MIATALPFLGRNWKLLGTLAVIGGLVLALGVQSWRLSSSQSANRELSGKIGQLTERLSTTRASLDVCLAEIDDNNRRIEIASKRFAEDQQAAAAMVASTNARWEAAKSSVSALEASARDVSRPACKVSEQALKALEGL